MRAAGKLCDWHRRGQIDMNVILVFGFCTLWQIRHRRPLIARSAVIKDRSHIPGSYDSRIDKLIDSVCGCDQLRVVKVNRNIVAGHNICNIHCKYIRSLF